LKARQEAHLKEVEDNMVQASKKGKNKNDKKN